MSAGVTFLDHTADFGIDVEARSFDVLLDRAARGMLALLRGEEDDAEARPDEAITGIGPGAAGRPMDGDVSPDVTLELEAADPVDLMADWLRDLLFLHEVRHLDYAGARFESLREDRLTAHVAVRPARAPVREIKGVTYHELAVRSTDTGWRARVIFDV